MPKIIFASTRESDMRYVLGMEIPDACFYLETETKKYVFLDHREIGVFEEKNKNPEVEGVLSVPLFGEARKIEGETSLENKLALHIIRSYGFEKEEIEVPTYFPLDMADFLRAQGIVLKVVEQFFPQRAVKTEKEISLIRENIKKTIKAFEKIEKILHASKIEGNKIKFEGKFLTSEFLKLECDRVLLEEGMFNELNIIISSATHTAMPHHMGTGELFAHQPIVCDIFPRNRENGYYADMTRTYVKGKPTVEFCKMYETVLLAQQKAFDLIKNGIVAKSVYQAVCEVFTSAGFHVGDVGFVHGVGHGLGLDVHELPYINASYDGILESGHVVTVEPGLYYSKHGGVRIEDVVVVRKDGCENLTNYPKNFQID